MKYPLILIGALLCAAPFAAAAPAPASAADKAAGVAGAASAASVAGATLPFDREVINRYSLGGRPRSLSLRQGSDVWLGYDLEQAKAFKVWQAPAGKPGVLMAVFVARASGTMWFDDSSNDTWQLQRSGQTVSLAVRYLGCSQRETYFELAWELKHDTGVLKLRERIARAGAPAPDRVVRELRVESLAAGEALLPPPTMRQAWTLTARGKTSAPALVGADWHRFTLP
ncbi:MAG: hypothetical protein V4773_07435 [Verrucomicrobiota bacterium]